MKKSPPCPVCGKPITEGVAYFSFGAVVDLLLLDEMKLSEDVLEGFCRVGYHGADVEVRDSVDYCIGDSIKGGQLDISFCSLACIRTWFCHILDELERELEKCRSKIGQSQTCNHPKRRL